jgi:transposase InsO family protein
MKLFDEPGESVQVEVKFVKIAGRWAFQYTALDDCTRFRVLRLYRRLHQSSSLAFLGELCRAFPFRIRKLQCDKGQEFPFAFALAVQALVERSHRIDQEEFWERERFTDFDAAAVGLRAWETRYNHERFSLALQGRTLAEKLAALLPAPAA